MGRLTTQQGPLDRSFLISIRDSMQVVGPVRGVLEIAGLIA